MFTGTFPSTPFVTQAARTPPPNAPRLDVAATPMATSPPAAAPQFADEFRKLLQPLMDSSSPHSGHCSISRLDNDDDQLSVHVRTQDEAAFTFVYEALFAEGEEALGLDHLVLTLEGTIMAARAELTSFVRSIPLSEEFGVDVSAAKAFQVELIRGHVIVVRYCAGENNTECVVVWLAHPTAINGEHFYVEAMASTSVADSSPRPTPQFAEE